MDEPIRILHVFGRLDAGGAESRTMDIYRNIDRSKIQFDFAIHTDDHCFYSDEVESLGGRIFNVPRFNGKNYLQYKKAWKTLFKNHPEIEVVHGHQTSTAFVYLNEAKKAGIIKRIAHARNSKKDSKLKALTTKLAKYSATKLLAVSDLAASGEFGKKRTKQGHVEIIPNGIDSKEFQFDLNERNKVRSELGISNERCIVHIGRFHQQKNHTFLIDIFHELTKKKSDVKLFLVGDGQEKEQIEQKINSLNLGNKIEFLGVRKDIHNLLQAMDIMVFPSFYEGLPGVVLEAQASGLPVILSDKITKQVEVNDNVLSLKLNQTKQDWVLSILKTINYSINNRLNYSINFQNSEYDIAKVREIYTSIYQSNKSWFVEN